MVKQLGSLVVVGLAVLWGGAIPSLEALTVYRIGGADLPEPQIGSSHSFVQLAWSAVDPKLHGLADLVEMEPGFIRPVRLDPQENIAPKIFDLAGAKVIVMHSHSDWTEALEGDDFFIFDNDPDTAYLGDGHWPWGSLFSSDTFNLGIWGLSSWRYTKVWVFDLGGLFNIERIRFYPRSRFNGERFVQRFVIGTTDGDPFKDGTRAHKIRHRGFLFDFDVAHRVEENTQSVVELAMPSEPIQRILLDAPENASNSIWEIAEFEIYGAGFATTSSYTSNIIDLGRGVSLGQISWGGKLDDGAQIKLQMRSGDTPEPNNYWRFTFRGDEQSRFGQDGQRLDLAAYNKLNRGEQAGITPDTENWTAWSAPYVFADGQGAPQSNKPRRYVQFRVDFTSQKEASARLDYLQFAVSDPPIASQALAEIAPVRVMPGEVTAFTYAILPTMAREDLGFDSIEILTPVQVAGVDQVRMGGQNVAFEVGRLDQHGFELSIPKVDVQRTDERIEVDFRAEIFKFGTVFEGRIFDSQQPFEVRQALTPGNADPLADGNSLSVGLIDTRQRAIQALRLADLFSPNGDGINDLLLIEFDLLNLSGAVPVELAVYDLSGRRLATVPQDGSGSGRFVAAWDGRGASGALVPPGLYILRLKVEADSGDELAQRTVSLVY